LGKVTLFTPQTRYSVAYAFDGTGVSRATGKHKELVFTFTGQAAAASQSMAFLKSQFFRRKGGGIGDANC